MIPVHKNVHELFKREFVTLIVLDGLGITPQDYGNAVMHAKTPFLDTVWTKGRRGFLDGSGRSVGLPDGIPGNSEVGHLNLGAGKVVYQNLTRINDEIKSGRFTENKVLLEALKVVKERGSKLHLYGILSDAGVHGHIDHLFEIMRICTEHNISPYIHAVLDGRDTPPTDGLLYLSQLLRKIRELNNGQIASLSGRFYSMDRDQRWERTELAYETMIGQGPMSNEDPVVLLQKTYSEGLIDETFLPTMFADEDGEPIGRIEDDDVVIFYNYREDRARQLTKAFVQKKFDKFEREEFLEDLHLVTMTGYEDGLNTSVLFEPHPIVCTLGSVLSDNGLRHYHTSESEKFMHVTYFFNGGIEKAYEGEERFYVNSPRVMNYAETPRMSAEATTSEILRRLGNRKEYPYSFLLINFANPDMLGHTGDVDATVEAIEFIDGCVKKIVEATLYDGGAAVITSDHGNCEVMIDKETGNIDTYHNVNPVPLIIVSEESETKESGGELIYRLGTGVKLEQVGILADIAPTILSVLDIAQPQEMTGMNLLNIV